MHAQNISTPVKNSLRGTPEKETKGLESQLLALVADARLVRT